MLYLCCSLYALYSSLAIFSNADMLRVVKSASVSHAKPEANCLGVHTLLANKPDSGSDSVENEASDQLNPHVVHEPTFLHNAVPDDAISN